MERGQLVAERLACARRHHRNRIVTFHDRLDDGLLSRSEFFQAERASHEPFDWSNWACHVGLEQAVCRSVTAQVQVRGVNARELKGTSLASDVTGLGLGTRGWAAGRMGNTGNWQLAHCKWQLETGKLELIAADCCPPYSIARLSRRRAKMRQVGTKSRRPMTKHIAHQAMSIRRVTLALRNQYVGGPCNRGGHGGGSDERQHPEERR